MGKATVLTGLLMLGLFGLCCVLFVWFEHSIAMAGGLSFVFCVIVCFVMPRLFAFMNDERGQKILIFSCSVALIAGALSVHTRYSPADLVRWAFYGVHDGSVKDLNHDPQKGFWRVVDVVEDRACVRETIFDEGEGDYSTYYAYGFRSKTDKDEGFWVVAGKKIKPWQVLVDGVDFYGVVTTKKRHGSAAYSVPKDNTCTLPSTSPKLEMRGRMMTLTWFIVWAVVWCVLLLLSAVWIERKT